MSCVNKIKSRILGLQARRSCHAEQHMQDSNQDFQLARNNFLSPRRSERESVCPSCPCHSFLSAASPEMGERSLRVEFSLLFYSNTIQMFAPWFSKSLTPSLNPPHHLSSTLCPPLFFKNAASVCPSLTPSQGWL